MTQVNFEASVRQLGKMQVIDLRGEINADADDVLTDAYRECTLQNPSSLLLNFEGVDYINSTGIAVIASLLAQARGAGSLLLASGLSDHFQEIFRITRLTDFMSIYPDEKSAFTASLETTERRTAEQ